MATPKGRREHIVPPFFVYFWPPEAPSNDGCGVSFSYHVLLLRAVRVAPKPSAWLIRLTPALGNWSSYSCLGKALLRHTKACDVYPRLGLYPETAQPGSRKRFTGGALLSSSCVALLAKPFLREATLRAFHAVGFHSQFLFTRCYELGISPLLAAVTLGSHSNVIRVQAMLIGIGLLRRLRKSDAAVGPRPRSLSGNSRKKFPRKIYFRGCSEMFRPRLGGMVVLREAPDLPGVDGIRLIQ